jgi:hypothetical protein
LLIHYTETFDEMFGAILRGFSKWESDRKAENFNLTSSSPNSLLGYYVVGKRIRFFTDLSENSGPSE